MILKLHSTPLPQSASVDSLQWMENQVICMSDDGSVSRYCNNFDDNYIMFNCSDYTIISSHVSPSSEDVWAAACSDGTLRIFTKSGKEEINVTACNAGALISIRWNFDGTAIVTGGENGEVKIWGRNGLLRATVATSTNPIYGVSWSPLGNQVAYIAGTMVYIVPLVSEAKPLSNTLSSSPLDRTSLIPSSISWVAHASDISCIEWSQRSGLIATGSQDGIVKGWDAYGRLLFENQMHSHLPKTSSSSASSLSHVSGHLDITAANEHQERTNIHAVTALTWHPSGSMLFAGSFERLRVFNNVGVIMSTVDAVLATPVVSTALTSKMGPETLIGAQSITSLAVDPFGICLVVGTSSGKVLFSQFFDFPLYRDPLLTVHQTTPTQLCLTRPRSPNNASHDLLNAQYSLADTSERLKISFPNRIYKVTVSQSSMLVFTADLSDSTSSGISNKSGLAATSIHAVDISDFRSPPILNFLEKSRMQQSLNSQFTDEMSLKDEDNDLDIPSEIISVVLEKRLPAIVCKSVSTSFLVVDSPRSTVGITGSSSSRYEDSVSLLSMISGDGRVLFNGSVPVRADSLSDALVAFSGDIVAVAENNLNFQIRCLETRAGRTLPFSAYLHRAPIKEISLSPQSFSIIEQMEKNSPHLLSPSHLSPLLSRTGGLSSRYIAFLDAHDDLYLSSIIRPVPVKLLSGVSSFTFVSPTTASSSSTESVAGSIACVLTGGSVALIMVPGAIFFDPELVSASTLVVALPDGLFPSMMGAPVSGPLSHGVGGAMAGGALGARGGDPFVSCTSTTGTGPSPGSRSASLAHADAVNGLNSVGLGANIRHTLPHGSILPAEALLDPSLPPAREQVRVKNGHLSPLAVTGVAPTSVSVLVAGGSTLFVPVPIHLLCARVVNFALRGRFERALRICRMVSVPLLWASLAYVAVCAGSLEVLEECFANLGTVEKLQYIHDVRNIKNISVRSAMFALYTRSVDEAEAVYLQSSPPMLYHALKLNIKQGRWSRALEIAKSGGMNQNLLRILVGYRQRFCQSFSAVSSLSSSLGMETMDDFVALNKSLGVLEWDHVKSLKKQLKEQELQSLPSSEAKAP